jgi:hypothetical protein
MRGIVNVSIAEETDPSCCDPVCSLMMKTLMLAVTEEMVVMMMLMFNLKWWFWAVFEAWGWATAAFSTILPVGNSRD